MTAPPGPMTSFTCSQMRRSVGGCTASAFQMLLIQFVLRVAMMSSNTAGLGLHQHPSASPSPFLPLLSDVIGVPGVAVAAGRAWTLPATDSIIGGHDLPDRPMKFLFDLIPVFVFFIAYFFAERSPTPPPR